ncbi:MAG: Hsp33 family molecular chaperone [Anderseniella sp.]
MTEPSTLDITTVISVEDAVLPFDIKPLGVRGRVVRLGAILDDILNRHDYPMAASAVLAEAVALVAMFGAVLKFNGKFILQTSTDGPVSMLVADFVSPDQVRGYARVDTDALARLQATGAVTAQTVIGNGHLAMTVDQGEDMERYQGIVGLDNATLVDAAHDYFRQSEQIPTLLRLASGPLVGRAGQADKWRAGAIMIQHLPEDGGISPIQVYSGDDPSGNDEPEVEEDDNWRKAKLLLETVEDHELIDPLLSSERVLYRLFHEDGVTVYPELKLKRYCSCSADRLKGILANMPNDDKAHMAEDGKIDVKCEFCSASYRFDVDEIVNAG